MQSAKTSRVLRPYSPSKWYDCWKHRIETGLSSHNKFFKSLNEEQCSQLHYWLSQCFMKMDLLLFDHDNHAIQLETTFNESDRNMNNIRFVSKHALPRALITSTELPIGYVNFKKYTDFLRANNENLYSDLLSSELGAILEAQTSDISTENEYYKHCHPTQTFWTPKYDSIEGYAHPIWEMVDSAIEYLYRMSVYFHKYDFKLRLQNYDGMEISDALIHYCVTQTFINRYIKEFSEAECPNPVREVSENPPQRLCDKYSHISPLFLSEIFRIIHLNAYVNQSLYARTLFGHGLYSMSAFYEHSCDPNLVYATFDGKLRMVLVKEIRECEPVTTSYLAEFIDQIGVAERKQRLRYLGFNCKCARCVSSSETETEMSRSNREETVLPTLWSELRFFHYVLSEGIAERWKSRLFRLASFGSQDLMVKLYMGHKIKTGICEPAYECFHTLDVLCLDAALNDVLCCVALKKKYRKKYFDRDTSDRELQISNM